MFNLNTAGPGGTPIPNLDQTALLTEYPYGKCKNDDPPGALNGTPIQIEVGAEPLQAMYACLVNGGVVPSGNAEKVTACDFLESLENMFFEVGDLKLRYKVDINNTNWLPCDGSSFDQVSYPKLFAFLGSATLPNLKGKVPVCYDSADVTFDTIGVQGGEKEHTLTELELAPHNHPAQKGTGDGVQFGGIFGSGIDLVESQNVGFAGGGEPHNNLQPYTVVQYFIKAR